MKLKVIEFKIRNLVNGFFPSHFWSKFHFINRSQKIGITIHMDIYNDDTTVLKPNSRCKSNLAYIP